MNHTTSQTEPELDIPNATNSFEQNTEISALNANDEKMDGVELNAYAEKEDLSIHEVWEQIKSGELVARISDTKIYVYKSEEINNEKNIPGVKDTLVGASYAGHLPPLPIFSEDELDTLNLEVSYTSQENLLPQTTNQSVELSLLLDHLSLAKEEQRDLIKMTQNTIDRISKMTELALESKVELLNHRNQRIEELESLLRQNEVTISKLKQEVEDLEILNRQLSEEN